jgi:hypothetical protein
VEPNPLNPPGIFTDTRQTIAFDMTKEGEKLYLEKAPDGGAIVQAYTDLKRYNRCDDPDRPDPLLLGDQLAQSRPDQDGRPGTAFFLTRKL